MADGNNMADIKNMNNDEKLIYIIAKLNKYEKLFDDLKEIKSQVNLLNDNVNGLAAQMAVLEEENKQQEILINNNKTRINTLLNKDTDRQESIVTLPYLKRSNWDTSIIKYPNSMKYRLSMLSQSYFDMIIDH